ncbi:hypothetical protein C8F04DRAFT_1202168 [Mycena alexandri]|uniref:Uncharacterized protein n=1 Tax=Mycena alexandri TaxID=1745969 RepID=A0AAD6RWV4_9AGAR|nr:hypothetical protein C8F04DRAFT_1202168 [Mycena alexandri]
MWDDQEDFQMWSPVNRYLKRENRYLTCTNAGGLYGHPATKARVWPVVRRETFSMRGGFSSIALVVEGEAEGGAKSTIVTAGQQKDSTAEEWHVHAGNIGVFLRAGRTSSSQEDVGQAPRAIRHASNLSWGRRGLNGGRQTDQPACPTPGILADSSGFSFWVWNTLLLVLQTDFGEVSWMCRNIHLVVISEGKVK